MEVTIKIPQSIINTCKECKWDEQQTKAIFLAYLDDIMQHPYNQFKIDFDNWINGDGEDYIDDILNSM